MEQDEGALLFIKNLPLSILRLIQKHSLCLRYLFIFYLKYEN